MILRDLVARITFKTDTSELRKLESTMGGVKRSIAAIAGTAISTFAIKAGADIQLLESQFNTLERAGTPLREEMERLQNLNVGGESIFSRKAVLAAGIGFRQLGFEGDQAAKLLAFASDSVVRTGGDFLGAAQKIGAGIKEGGATDFLLSLDLINIKVADKMRFLEGQIAAGDPFGTFTRDYRDQVFDAITKAGPELRAEVFKFLETKGSGAATLRVTAQMENLWTTVTNIITTSLEPALNKVADIIGTMNKAIKDWEPEIRQVADAFEDLLNLELGAVTAGTVGALLGFLITGGNPLGALAGALSGIAAFGLAKEPVKKALGDEGNEIIGPNSALFRTLFGNPNDPNNKGGLLGLPPKGLRLPRAKPAAPVERDLGVEEIFEDDDGFGDEALSSRGRGNVIIQVGGITIQGDPNPEATVARLSERLLADTRRAYQSFVFKLEG